MFLNFVCGDSGVSSFNQFIHELSVDSDTSSLDYSSGEDSDGIYPATPSSRSSRFSRSSTFAKYETHWTEWITYIFSWILLPAKFFLRIPLHLFHLSYARRSKTPSDQEGYQPSPRRSFRKTGTLKDHVVHRTTDRRRGVIEVPSLTIFILS